MVENKKLYAPEIKLYQQYFRSNSLNKNTSLTEQSQKLYNMLLSNIKKIKPTSEKRTIWELWFKTDKGSLEDFGNYEELHEDGVYDTYEQFVEAYNEYDKDEYWFKLTFITEADYSALWIDDSNIIAINSRQECGFPYDFDELLTFLNNELNSIVDMVVNDTYNEYLNKNLPYEYRHGVIQRKILWELAPELREFDIKDLTEEDIGKFVRLSQNTRLEPTERLKQMTAGKYYEFCSLCYHAAKYSELDGKTPKQMFEKYGDSRDGGLSQLEENSAEDFEKWFNLSDKEKWDINNPSHMWEISQGSSRTRLFLYMTKDDNGYYLELSGGKYNVTDEIVKMFVALRELRIPVVLYNAEAIKNKILGLDNIGVISEYEDSCSYTYGGFEESKILNFVRLDDIPEVNRYNFIKSVKWFPLCKIESAI